VDVTAVRRSGTGDPVVARELGSSLVRDVDGRLVTPEVATLYSRIRARGVVGYDVLGVAAARETVRRAASLAGAPPPIAEVRDLSAGDLAPSATRVYRASPEASLLVVYLHGGGWVTGDLDTSDVTARRLAAASHGVVVAVDYPLSPESPASEIQEAVTAAIRQVAGERERLGTRRDRLVVVGDSAGAYLAGRAALSLQRVVTDLALFYPVVAPPPAVGSADGSWTQHADDPVLSASSMRWFWSVYTAPAGPSDAPDLAAADFADLRRALVVTSGLDLLQDEGQHLAHRLRATRAEVTSVHLPGTCHGFLPMAGALPEAMSAAMTAFDRWVAELDQQTC